ncbi:MAG: Lrp/AsnC family transcriptional regulator [Pseudomonadota bacterium]
MVEKKKTSKYQVDELDLMLIKELEANSRQSNRQIAKKLGVTSTTVQIRLQRLLDERMIKIIPVLNPVAMKFQTRAFFGLNITPGSSNAAVVYLKPLACVQTINITAGHFDMTLFAVFHDIEEMLAFVDGELSKVPGLVSIEEIMVLKVVKRTWAHYDCSAGLAGLSEQRDLDESETRLIDALKLNPRETIMNLSRKLGLSRKLISRKLTGLVNDNIIAFTILVIPERSAVQAQVFLKVYPGEINNVATALATNKKIAHVLIVSGQFKVFFAAVFRNMEECIFFINGDMRNIPGINSHETAVSVASLKQSVLLG